NYFKQVEIINSLEVEVSNYNSSEIKQKTTEFKKRFEAGEKLSDLLPESFAIVRETSKRVLGMRHFDEQLVGGMALHDGKIAEMKTGEGKTLVATLPAYLNCISGKSVHVITVNDYLARRDAEWMGQIFEALGITVGVVLSQMESSNRKAAYDCDVTYGTNNEFGFDYLRDNMAFQTEQRVQRDLTFAIVDEVDSILIDEARTPLIISGPADDKSDIYRAINKIVPMLTPQLHEDGEGDFSIDEKSRQVHLTEEGHERLEKILVSENLIVDGESLYSANNVSLMQYVNAAIRATKIFQKNTDYVIKNREIVIVDEFTGRTMPGRRWSEGLHQAIEAKEGLKIQAENQTLATITYQNYFRQYDKLSGMTGTADTEAYEFQEIYGLEVVVIPTHRPMIREDKGDLIYLSSKEKFDAIIEDVEECSGRGQPVLVGTTSIETSEYLSKLLKKKGIRHSVLNAKFHEKEAQIIANAGRVGAITVATNMAGRGTDIVLGGSSEPNANDDNKEFGSSDSGDWELRNKEVIERGGLHIIGTERHESRRIDNQLRGRSGRQGDPGSSRFYLSLDDNLIRIFASEKIVKYMQMAGMQEGEAIEHPWVTKAIENAQRKVEGRNFDIRKQLLEFDDVANDQRQHIYEQRRELMESVDISENITRIREDVVGEAIDSFVPTGSFEEEWDLVGLSHYLLSEYKLSFSVPQWFRQNEEVDETTIRREINKLLSLQYEEKEKIAGPEVMREFEKNIMLQVVDSNWKEHLASMDYLRQGIHLRGFAQKNPKQEYKREAFEYFSQMLSKIMREVVGVLLRVDITRGESLAEVPGKRDLVKRSDSSQLLTKNKKKEQRKRRRKSK
ncbi:MAG: preprotein translocase subunit SecA, partial [Pseudomonadota bacterium]|nr:preprotein translocase subunit SecA [Pseudomonadota bacterium]